MLSHPGILRARLPKDIQWPLALCHDDAKQGPMVYVVEFGVVLLAKGPRAVSYCMASIASALTIRVPLADSQNVQTCFCFCIAITADGLQRASLPISPNATLVSCLRSLRIFPYLPTFRLRIFISMQIQQLLHIVNRWLNFTYSRSHGFRYGTTIK